MSDSPSSRLGLILLAALAVVGVAVYVLSSPPREATDYGAFDARPQGKKPRPVTRPQGAAAPHRKPLPGASVKPRPVDPASAPGGAAPGEAAAPGPSSTKMQDPESMRR